MNSDFRTRLIAAGIAAAVPLVAAFEGLRQTAYLDPVGIPTACFGATKGVRLGQVYTREQCDDLLAKDLLEANAGVDSCVHVPLTEGQRIALVSFTYNVGRGAFCGSTLVRKLNARDYVGACNELPRWVYAKGVKLPGLVNRREQERALCLG
ncbi:lysozyme [Cupriavidus gilardii]|uniref:Lysozyme n=1 Tax=Cupriavidus gilardii TaxID=82541 RepID=A0ABY4VTY7_9BURK|nr:lysozyme [Cupriavidus gilardii]USE78818.1 lysozyme [Cupriavidus gilardii]